MAFGPVQSLGATGGTVTLPGVTSGNTIVFCCTTSPGIGSPTLTVADNHGNSYTPAMPKIGSGSNLWTFYLLNATAGSNTVTATVSGGGLTIDSCMAREYPAAYASALDKTSSNAYTGGPVTTATSNATTTLSQALETVIGIYSSFNAVTIAAGTGFGNLLEETDGSIASLAMEDQPVNSTAGVAATFNTTTIPSYQCAVLTFLSTYVPPSGTNSNFLIFM